nr:SH3 domain-containing protein [uncultured Allomuricauda sp.]
MKIRFALTVGVVLFIFSLSYAQKIHDVDSFKSGDQVYVFGNDVKLRSAPKTESDVLKLLKIGEWVEILEKTEFSWPYKGFDSPFYKVKYDTTEGYILGGLLSLERKTLGYTHYYFAVSREGERSFLNMRHRREGTYLEKKIPIPHENFSIQTLGNKGVYGLDDILFINYHSEACMMEGGGIYFFVQNDTIHEVGQLSEISDAGIFHLKEKLIFPKDEDGIPNTILFKKVTQSILDDETEWVQTTIETRKLRWISGKLTPDFREKLSN